MGEHGMISFTDRETSVSLPESKEIYQDDEERPNPPFLERIQRSEWERRSMDRLSYDGCSQSLVRPTYQEQEPEIAITKHEILEWMLKEGKEKIVIVNGPEIQQPNHDVIDKEQQQQGRDFIGVRKLDPTSKRIISNLEILFSFVKYSLILFLVGFPVADCNHQDLKWLPTNTIVKGVYQTDVQLVWKYQSNLMLDKIDISRKKVENEKEDVALWTPDEGSKPNTLLSTDVTLEHRKEGGVGTIILTLIKPYPVDFDKQYNCTVYFEHGVDSMEIELQSYKVEYQPVADVVEARPGDDVQFVWIYKYPLPVNIIEFHNNLNKTETEMAYWYKEWRFIIEDEYRDRLRFDQKQNQGNETEITLTLLNTTLDDFNITYYGNAIATNGYQSSSGIYLTVEEEKPKPVKKTISPVEETISAPSSASRPSQVPMFLICSVLLLSVQI